MDDDRQERQTLERVGTHSCAERTRCALDHGGVRMSEKRCERHRHDDAERRWLGACTGQPSCRLTERFDQPVCCLVL